MEKIYWELKKAIDLASPLETFEKALDDPSVKLDRLDIDFILICRSLLPLLMKEQSNYLEGWDG